MVQISLAAQNKVFKQAQKLVGVHEIPDGTNRGPMVHQIQGATGAFAAPWCVSFAQYVWKKCFGKTYANASASVYYVADYATKHAHTVPQPIPGCWVAFHIGAGHMGIVMSVNPDKTFHTIEGNEANAVRWMLRDPRSIRCTFIVPPELRAKPV